MDRVAEFRFVMERTRDGIAAAGIKLTTTTTAQFNCPVLSDRIMLATELTREVVLGLCLNFRQSPIYNCRLKKEGQV